MAGAVQGLQYDIYRDARRRRFQRRRPLARSLGAACACVWAGNACATFGVRCGSLQPPIERWGAGAASVGMDVEAREGGEQVTCGQQHSAALTSLNGVGESRADHDPIHE